MSKAMWILLIIVAAATGSAFAYKMIQKGESQNRDLIDKWVEDVLSNALSRKLNRPVSAIREALGDKYDAGLIVLINETVRSVSLLFSRISGHKIETRLNLLYKDGTSFAATTEFDWDQMPETIRAEFLREGKADTTRDWYFPWQAA